MKLYLAGRVYDASLPPFIGDLRKLNKKLGFGWATIQTRLAELEGSKRSLADLFEDEHFAEPLLGWLWMIRLRAGDRDVTFTDIEQMDISQVAIVDDPDDEQRQDEAADPTSAPMDSDRGDDEAPPAAPARTRTSTKSSKRRSTRG